MHRYICAAVILITLLLCCGCPQGEDEVGRDPRMTPSEPIPTEGELLEWAGLRLGMSQLEMSQAYNAPDGQGDGFTRLIQDSGDFSLHTIRFEQPREESVESEQDSENAVTETEEAESEADDQREEPEDQAGETEDVSAVTSGYSRRILASFYKDKLYSIIDRRDGFNTEERDAWFAEAEAQFGTEHEATLPTSQWVWQGDGGVHVEFTQDNASEQSMSGFIWLLHQPTEEAADIYIEQYEEEQAAAQR